MMVEKTDILIVDDCRENLTALEALLESPDLNIVRAVSGNEALGLTLDHDFALILLDVQMPEMDGFETAELLRAREKTRHIPIIFVTAISKESRHVFRGYEKGAVDYLFKPLEPRIMRSKVDIFVELHRQKRALEKTRQNLEQVVSQLSTSREKLKKSEEKYRLLIENANDAILILQDGRIRFHNPRTEALSGYTSCELSGTPFMDYVHPEDREMVAEKHALRLSGNGNPGIYPFRCLNRDARELWLEGNAIRVIWEKKNAVLCFLRDITRQRKLEIQLQQAQKMEAIGTLAGGIAHDFNNILGVIIGYTEMSVQEAEDTELVRHNLSQVLKAGNRAKELVRQILAFSHKTEQDRKPVILNPIVREALKLLRASLPRTIDIREFIGPELLRTLSNPTQIHQVLMNLCTNAAHAMEEKGGTLKVSLKAWNVGPDTDTGDHELLPGDYIRLTVSDTGHGMDATTMSKMFDPYFTTKKIGKGTGMGLAVVHGIVQSHNGSVSVCSNPGQGTVFEIVIPRLTDHETVPEKEVSTPLPTGEQRILFVDDEALLSELGKSMLDRLGYDVDCRTSPVDALRAFEARPDAYDLIITDMTMPQMTGDILSREIIRIRPDIPIIICTGYSEQLNEEKARALGIRDFLMKPLSLTHLARTVEKALAEAEDAD
ncbi:hybrid sensor histidine kinase/response regulato r [Desulfonema ishimotonii]|uniref:histidine kinase n=1 Tax=Desulfonema ishimotonii TaxID=45657 RepID=A0A401FV47_9BACT|nr:response regulator [Desulfonema ishimotonii]GBC60841.1 hybrid sensor histidine kinase/response regulato r [Desulfonema ishimotonii]